MLWGEAMRGNQAPASGLTRFSLALCFSSLPAVVSCGGGGAAPPPATTTAVDDRKTILAQELGEIPTPQGPCPGRTEPNVLENPRATVQRTALGLAYCFLKEGPPGVVPGAEDTVRVHYTGWTIEGQMFDSSHDRGEPLDLPLNGVIRGWTEGLRLMTPGDQARLWIPGHLGYGHREPGQDAGKPPKGTLIFDIELIDVIRQPPVETSDPKPATADDDSRPRLAPRPLPPSDDERPSRTDS